MGRRGESGGPRLLAEHEGTGESGGVAMTVDRVPVQGRCC